MQPDRANVSAQFDEQQARFPVAPGIIALALGLLLIALITIGVIVNARSAHGGVQTLTIAELRADPDRHDNQTVRLIGHASRVRELPVLSQYALYTFNDATGSMLVLSQRGVPPVSAAGADPVQLRAVFHSRVTLDDELRRIVEEQFGSLAASLVGLVVPNVAINAVYLEHVSYEQARGQP